MSVANNDAEKRFETVVDGVTAFLTYRRNGQRIVLIHTEVPEEIGGRGIAADLSRAALAYAREHDLTVVPACPYVKAFLEKHPDEARGTKIDMIVR